MNKDVADSVLLKEDKEYVIKKFDISDSEFERIMNLEPKTFSDYKSNYKLTTFMRRVIHFLRAMGILHK